jgi:hypothetical protein
VWSLPGEMEVQPGGRGIVFISSLTWRWDQREDLGGLMHTPMLVLRYPKSMWWEISTLT